MHNIIRYISRNLLGYNIYSYIYIQAFDIFYISLLLTIKCKRILCFIKPVLSSVTAAKEVGNGRSPLLQDPLFGGRPQPYSE